MTIGVTFVAGSAVMAGIACLAQGSRWLGRAGIGLAVGGFLLWVEQVWANHWQLFAVLLIRTLLGEILTPVLERSAAANERPVEGELGTLHGISVVAVRHPGKRVVRIGDRETPLAADESVDVRRT